RKIYRNIVPDYVNELRKELQNCSSILDLGCGENSPLRFITKKGKRVGIDIFAPSIQKSKGKRIHDAYKVMNIEQVSKAFKKNSFDAVIALDLVEHLNKKESLRAIENMEQIARKKVIIFTPNGFLPQKPYDNNPHQTHKFGWTVNELQNQGYKVLGMNGWKLLRKEYDNSQGYFSTIRFFPKYAWLVIAEISQFFVKHKPQSAFQLFCTKNLKQNKN
ncbi:MAG: class I SAM-dependent methyltransferase, partial [Candidatus Woesearchaeota archaeon]|nr:class I SAM-dependent methyltransferase [Candidatus Woesearchaeota archaeon]